jgi:hypothetical protein
VHVQLSHRITVTEKKQRVAVTEMELWDALWSNFNPLNDVLIVQRASQTLC